MPWERNGGELFMGKTWTQTDGGIYLDQIWMAIDIDEGLSHPAIPNDYMVICAWNKRKEECRIRNKEN